MKDIAEACGVSIHTSQRWRDRNSIPADQWATFARKGWATLEELAEAASKERAA